MEGRQLGAIGLGVVVLLALVGAFALLRRRQLLAHTPTSRCAAVFAGWNEVRGRAYTATPTTSHFSRLACVYWHYSVEEERRSTRTVTSTDSEGRTSSRQETSYNWVTIDEGGDMRDPFLVVDDSGSVAVAIAGAKLKPTTVVSRVLGSRAFFGGDGPTGRTRETENVIALGEQVFACGDAVLDPDAGAPVLRGSEGGPNVIATGDEGEERVARGYKWSGAALAVGAVALGGLASALALSAEGASNAPAWIPGLLVAAVFCFGAACVLAYNGLVRVRNRADRAWSLIEVMLQRRHDLIGRLAEVVRGYAAHEADLQAKLAALRSGAPSGFADADATAAAQTEAAVALFARAEAYPDLKAADPFVALQQAIADTEDRVGAAREFYNESVTAMRDRTHTFPGSLLARFGDFPDRPLFEAERFARSTPHIAIEVTPTVVTPQL